LFDQAVAPGQADQKRRQKLSDRTSVDDQPMIRASCRVEQVENDSSSVMAGLLPAIHVLLCCAIKKDVDVRHEKA
jgi:hypothetical protein